MMSLTNPIGYLTFYVNGIKIVEHNGQPEWTLLWYLRNKCRLTGSKLGCGEGGCGACTVLISNHHPGLKKVIHRVVNGCLTSLCSVDGYHITTVEGLSKIQDNVLHPIPKRIAEFYGSQCGFCTPGIVMSLYGTLTNTDNATIRDIEDSFDGNLCRCTGYRPILDAAKTFASDKASYPCQRNHPGNSSTTIKTTEDKIQNYEETQCPVLEFPSSLLNYPVPSLHIKGHSIEWYRPTSLNELLSLKRQYPMGKIVSGNTMVQFDQKFKNKYYPILINISKIEELNVIEKLDSGMIIGAAVTIATFKEHLESWLRIVPVHQKSTCDALLNQLNMFGSQQIRNVATIGVNIMHSSPISSLNPTLQACNTMLNFINTKSNEKSEVALRVFFIDQDENENRTIASDHILLSIYIPFTERYEYLQSYKQSRRRQLDVPIVSCGFQVKLKHHESDSNFNIESICLSFGSMARCTRMMNKTQNYLQGKLWSRKTIKEAIPYLLDELSLNEFSPGGQPEYRSTLAISFLFKFYLYVTEQLEITVQSDRVSSDEVSAMKSYIRNVSRGEQEFQSKPLSNHVIGSSFIHNSAYLHGTGEAKYTCDIPMPTDGLHSALVLSTQAYAKILSIDTSKATQLPGFKTFISHVDVTGNRMTGDVVNDEEVFPSSNVYCMGTIIGLVVADSESQAEQASKLIDIQYECLSPLIMTIDQAVEHRSFLGPELNLKMGSLENGFQESDHVLNGDFYIGGQEHFYMETNGCLAIPHEHDELEIYASTQNATGIQEKVAAALGKN